MKRKNKYNPLALSLAILITGCAHQYMWVKPGASQSEFHADNYECQREAAMMYPAAIVNQQLPRLAGAGNTLDSDCRAVSYGGTTRMVCKTEVPNQLPDTVLVDANSNNRIQAVNSCLQAIGYRIELAR